MECRLNNRVPCALAVPLTDQKQEKAEQLAGTHLNHLSDLKKKYEKLVEKSEGFEELEEELESKRVELLKIAKGLEKREKEVRTAEKKAAARTIEEGAWAVGVDIQPDTYRSSEAVSSSCYWGIYRTGSNGADIIENDIPGGGRPSVTLSKGQDFTTRRCGTWRK